MTWKFFFANISQCKASSQKCTTQYTIPYNFNFKFATSFWYTKVIIASLSMPKLPNEMKLTENKTGEKNTLSTPHFCDGTLAGINCHEITWSLGIFPRTWEGYPNSILTPIRCATTEQCNSTTVISRVSTTTRTQKRAGNASWSTYASLNVHEWLEGRIARRWAIYESKFLAVNQGNSYKNFVCLRENHERVESTETI